MNKCYYCICTVCNMLNCPHGHDKFKHCYRACYSQNRRMPILDCDYFEHIARRKVYLLKRAAQSGKQYTNFQLGEMLEAVIHYLQIDMLSPVVEYEVIYDGSVIAVRNSLAEAKQFTQQFRNKEKIIIKRKGE